MVTPIFGQKGAWSWVLSSLVPFAFSGFGYFWPIPSSTRRYKLSRNHGSDYGGSAGTCMTRIRQAIPRFAHGEGQKENEGRNGHVGHGVIYLRGCLSFRTRQENLLETLRLQILEASFWRRGAGLISKTFLHCGLSEVVCCTPLMHTGRLLNSSLGPLSLIQGAAGASDLRTST